MENTFAALVKMRDGGSKHSSMVEFLTSSKHNGYDISEDSTMVAAYYKQGVILLSPYCKVNAMVALPTQRELNTK